MCLSHGTNDICLPPLLHSQNSAREKVGGMHLFIISFWDCCLEQMNKIQLGAVLEMFYGCFCVSAAQFLNIYPPLKALFPLSVFFFFLSPSFLAFLLCQAFLKLQPVSCLLCPKNGKACVCFRQLHHFKKKKVWVRELSARRSGDLTLHRF